MPLTLREILAVLDDPRSLHDLERYFRTTGNSSFTGGQFERLGGGGDRPGARDAITAEDLIAVELLSVRVPPRTALELLQGALGEAVAAELREIPTTIELGWEEAHSLIDSDGRADRAWRLLRNADGIGWVVAGKLLARKRPKLIPVYDEVVACAFQTGEGFWCWLHRLLREEDAKLVERLAGLRWRARLSEAISLLRILDVVVWMRHRNEHMSSGCAGLRMPSH